MISFDKSLWNGPPSIQVTQVELIYISSLIMWSKHMDLAERMHSGFLRNNVACIANSTIFQHMYL